MFIVELYKVKRLMCKNCKKRKKSIEGFEFLDEDYFLLKNIICNFILSLNTLNTLVEFSSYLNWK